jgi:alpha-beta hydrolase superfamily lysophospholipase
MGNIFSYTPTTMMMALSKVPKSVPLKGILDLNYLSHDSRVLQTYLKDPLNNLAIQSKLFFEILAEQKLVFCKPLRAKCPLFVSIGTEDRLVHPKYVIEYFSNIEKGTNLKVFEGAYHEIHNEIERYSVPYFEFLKNSLIS